MKRKIILIYFLSIGSIIAAQMDIPVHKTQIPISLEDGGIPLTSNNYGYNISGFEVDTKGNFYFLTSLDEKSILISKYSNEECLYMNQHKEFAPSRLYFYEGTLIILDIYLQKNNLFFLKSQDGEIIEEKSNILKEYINSYAFFKKYLILEVLDDQDNIYLAPKYYQLDLNGSLIKILETDFGLFGDAKCLPINVSDNMAPLSYLGEWEGKTLFYTIDLGNFDMVFYLYDPKTKNTKIQKFPQNYFGEQFYDPWLELMKLRNNKLFMVSYINSKVIVNEMEMKVLFH